MTTELTNAAQQATKQAPVLSDGEVRHYATCCVTTEDAIRAAEQKVLERALAQRHAAQEGAFCIYPKCLTTGGTCKGDCSKVPAPQQATPTTSGNILTDAFNEVQALKQQATPEPCVTRASAVEAISHVSLHNGPGRLAQAIAMLRSAATPEPEFDDCSSSPTGKHSESWFGNGDCDHCKTGAQNSPMIATPEPVGEPNQFPPLPEGWPARFRCDSCDGNGEIGELVSMGDFQPPERQTCPDCGGRGWTSEEPAFNAEHMREFAEAHARNNRPAPGVPAKLPSAYATSTEDGTWRVLLAFDNKDDAEATRRFLHDHGVQPRTMRSSAPAVPEMPQEWFSLLAEARSTAYDEEGYIMEPDLASAVEDIDAMLAAAQAKGGGQ